MAFPGQTFSIRNSIIGGSVVLALIGVGLSAYQLKEASAFNQESVGAVKLNDIVSDLMLVAKELAYERGGAYSSLKGVDKISAEDEDRLFRGQRLADGKFVSAIAYLEANGDPAIIDTLGVAKSRWLSVKSLRETLYTQLRLSVFDRNLEVAEQWMSASSALIRSIHQIQLLLLVEADAKGSAFQNLQAVKRSIALASEYVGLERAMLAARITRGERLSHDEEALLSDHRGRMRENLDFVRVVAKGTQFSLDIAVTVKSADDYLFGEFENRRRSIYAASSSGLAYPLSAQSWFDAATIAIDKLSLIGDAATEESNRLLLRKKSKSERAMVLSASLAICVVIIAGLVIWIMTWRTVLPLGNVVASLRALASGNVDVVVPHRRRRDEIGEIAGALALFQASVRENRRLESERVQFAKTADAAISAMPQGLCLFDADKRLVLSNSRFREMYELPAELVRAGTPLKAILDYQYRQGVKDEQTLEANLVAIPNLLQQTVSTGDGRVVSIKRTPVSGGGWVATHEDVTEERRRVELFAQKAAELESVNYHFDAALSHMHHGISMFDNEKRLIVWNARYAEMFGFPPEYLRVGLHVNDIAADLVTWGVLKGEKNKAAVERKVAAMDELTLESSWVEELVDGRSILLSRQPLGYGGWLATSEDITERLRAEAEINRLALHDPLTGLANRAEFNRRLEEACKRAKRYGSCVTIMMLDLDKFKQVNDTLGHPAGDLLLMEVSRRLKESLRDTDVLARLGGDEFAIIQEGGNSQHEGAIALALRIIKSVTSPFDLEGNQANIGTSIGIAMAPEHGADPEDLLKKADLALYEVKAAGRNDFRIFQSAMLEATNSRHAAEDELRSAIEKEEFELHYQPVFDPRTRELWGAEALVRWRHPSKGLIGPDQFIELAESTGLIVTLGAWVLKQACYDAASWPADKRVAVNVSAVQFKKGNLFDVILCTLVESGLNPERLEIEITESVLLDGSAEYLEKIRQLKNLGISFAIDDFGTGYSSINNLTVFPFDKIKIDKSFSQSAVIRLDHKAIVESVILLARGLNLKVTAEGIETEEQLNYLTSAGADLLQGYLLGRPVPYSEVSEIMNALPSTEMVA